MEETWKWVAGFCLSIAALVSTWIMARNTGHKKTHKDLYDRLERKADADFVKEEMKKLNDNLNTRIESHIHESSAINELLLNSMKEQGKLISSMDGKLNLVIEKLIKK